MTSPTLRRAAGSSADRIQIDRTPFLIGRHPSCQVVLEDAMSSGKHCRIVREGEQWVLEDLKSTNGTRVGGRKVTRATLSAGDRIEIGEVELVFETGGADTAFRLTAISGKVAGREVVLSGDRLQIGRHPSSGLVLDDDQCSGKHCQIVRDGDGHALVDLKSTNGTFLRERKVDRERLSHGDEIRIGGVRLVYHSPALGRPPVLDGGSFCLKLLGSRTEFKVRLEGSEATIGTDARDTFCLTPEPGIVGGHVRLVRRPGGWAMADVKGPTPVAVRGVAKKEHRFAHGDDLAIGPFHVVYLDESLPEERFLLTFAGGKRGGEEIELGSKGLSIGRVPANDLVLDSPDVSSRHARIEVADGKFSIEDLGSTNGTFVGGAKIAGRRALSHGDRIEIGGHALVFRSSGQERPEDLRRERFVLVPVRSSGAPIAVDKPTFRVGRAPDLELVVDHPKTSGNHALLTFRDGRHWLKDLDSTNGTYVNGERVDEETALGHGDRILFGRVEFVYKNDLVPLERFDEASIVPLAVGAALAAAILIVLAIVFATSAAAPPVDVADSGNAKPVSDPGIEDAATRRAKLEADFATARAEMAAHWPEKASRRLAGLLAETDLPRRKEVEETKARADVLRKATAELRREIRDRRGMDESLPVELGGRSLEIVDSDDDALTYVERYGPRDEDRGRIAWTDLQPAELVALLVQSGAAEEFPLETAAYAFTGGEEAVGLGLLVDYLRRNPSRGPDVDSIYATFLGRPVPPGGWILVGDRLGTREELAAHELATKNREAEEEERRRKELERMKAELEASKALEEARSALRDEFDGYLSTIQAFTLTLEYAKANAALEEYAGRLEALGLDDLAARVEDRLFEGRGEQALFEKLLRGLNEGTLVRPPVWRTASRTYSDVRFSDATEEGVRLDIPDVGEIYVRWRIVDPVRLYEFFGCLALQTAERYHLGKICLDRGLEDGARHQWVQVVDAKATDLAGRIDRHLATYRGVEIPPGGFVVYEGKFVTPAEKVNLAQGLVHFQGRWMTKDERDKLKAGLVQYAGKWLTKGEFEQLKALEEQEGYRAANEGFVREDGQWVYKFRKDVDGKTYLSVAGKYYPEDEARELRSQWENAWTIKTEHFDMRTNMDMEFAIEWADFMEEAWKVYAAYFKGEFDDRLELFAFRTYEDYRKYCEDTGNTSHLKAGGFAMSSNDRGVGWNSGNSKKAILDTMIHEAAHLYSFNVHPPHMMPSWYAEGIATQFEGYAWDSKTRKLTLDYVSRGRLGTVKSQILSGSGMKIADLVRGDALASINASPAAAGTFYATSWAFRHFLDRSTDVRVRPLADEYIRKMDAGEFGRGGNLGPAALDPVEQVFGSDLTWLQETYEAFIREVK